MAINRPFLTFTEIYFLEGLSLGQNKSIIHVVPDQVRMNELKAQLFEIFSLFPRLNWGNREDANKPGILDISLLSSDGAIKGRLTISTHRDFFDLLQRGQHDILVVEDIEKFCSVEAIQDSVVKPDGILILI